ncbi:hypothetical protein [uncultured Alistipes sp.]|uniref:hypothetical protein n=1 Tax=uncultured Alistipes sp. TaxID=538949 RepID=UPI0025FE47A8|nr:hypothetical protein [uncultured Alistipes sp.]
MKKVFIAAALFAALGFNAAYASTAIAPKAQISVTAENEFEAIETDQLPQAVKDAVAKSYEGQTIKAAYVKTEEDVKTYKVTLADAEGKTSDVLFNEKGEVLPAGEQK